MIELKTEDAGTIHAKIGLIVGDPLRSLGLNEIVREHCHLTGISLSVPGALHSFELTLAVLDSETVAELSAVLGTFRRQRPDLRVIALGPSADMDFIQMVIGAGAKGYLPWDAKEAEIAQCVEVVRDGSIWAPRKVLARLIESSEMRMASAAVESKFTGREEQVLKLLVEGRPNRDIASMLGIDEGTVKAHISRLMRKVGVRNRTALTMNVLSSQRVPN